MDQDWGGLGITDETFQSLINLFPKNCGGRGVKKFRDIPFFSNFELMYRNLLNFSVIFS